jgi:hypothetical protein
MTKRQYRISTEATWQSMFGQAIIAFQNTSGSGRKLTLRSLEIGINSIAGSSAPSATANLWRCTLAFGENMNYKALRMDSATALPAGVVVRRGGGSNAYSAMISKFSTLRSGAGAGTQNTLNNATSWGRFGGLYRSQRRVSAPVMEPITVAAGESVVMMPNVVQASMPLRVHAIASVNGRTVTWEYVTATVPGISLFSLENTGVATVKLLSLGIQEVGTTDTPYLRLVPIGQIKGEDVNDASRQIQAQVTPMDSSYPAMTALTIYTDVGIVPSGVPESYMTDTTAGTPRGFNYLHTKDFNGPTLRSFFPELEMNKPGGASEDMLGHGYAMRNLDIGVLRSGICINPGEGLAIVASAETAVNVQAAYSGWPSLTFSAQIDDEPQASPYLNLTGLQPGSDIVVLIAGTNTHLQQIDAYSSAAWAWNYDPDTVTSVDICIYKNGYVPLAIRALPLTVLGASIPISQVADRNFT